MEDRGFASMTREKQREIASRGGKRAHEVGTAHTWTSEEARVAGQKGGKISAQIRRRARELREQQAAAPQGSGAGINLPTSGDQL